MVCYRDALRAHQDRINRLNVYPVPDGDTGTNMALTLESVVSALEDSGDMASTCRAVSRGSLMGARGNSGVILSQVLRGVCDTCRELQTVGPGDLGSALRAASQAADTSVSRPVEGTILTVARAAADGAEEAAGRDKALVDVLEAARAAAADALERTPEMLPVLKESGVVDAGGVGLLLLLDALLHVAAARPLPEPQAVPAAAVPAAQVSPGQPHGEASDLRYEVMFFLEAPDGAVPGFKEAWAGIGDSVVVAGGDGLWNCHIHTDDVGAAIEAALDRGRPRDIRVTDLKEQVEEEGWVREAMAGTGQEQPAPERVATAVVAVAAGRGLDAMFRSLGAHAVVAGGQSMNPSTAEILAAVEAAPGEEVVVLPNNKNIVAVAEQVDALTAKAVRVVRTHAVAQGLAALLEYDPRSDATANVEAMTAAAGRVAWGEVTHAVRPSSCPAGPIREGDWLGISSRAVEVVATSPEQAAIGLLDKLVTDEHEIVTVLEGEYADQAQTSDITEWLRERRPGVTAEVHRGDQPVYPYLLAAE